MGDVSVASTSRGSVNGRRQTQVYPSGNQAEMQDAFNDNDTFGSPWRRTLGRTAYMPNHECITGRAEGGLTITNAERTRTAHGLMATGSSHSSTRTDTAVSQAKDGNRRPNHGTTGYATQYPRTNNKTAKPTGYPSHALKYGQVEQWPPRTPQAQGLTNPAYDTQGQGLINNTESVRTQKQGLLLRTTTHPGIAMSAAWSGSPKYG